MRIRVAHASLQFSDTDRQHTHDIKKIFERAKDRNYAWVMGTESGPGSGNISSELLRLGKAAGYRMWVPSEQGSGISRFTDAWIAVRKDLIAGDWEQKYQHVIPGSSAAYKAIGRPEDSHPRWAPKGLATVSFRSIPELGRISLATTHHLTKGKKPGPESVINGVDHHEWNMKLDKALTEWIQKAADGPDLAFASFDRNASDRLSKPIAGTVSIADELKKWQNTGHGDIDWIVKAKKDRRVKAHAFRVLNDKKFFLHTDHFFLEGVYNVEPLGK